MNRKAFVVLLISIGWGIFSWWWYTCPIKQVCAGSRSAETALFEKEPGRLLFFRLNESEPVLNPGFDGIKSGLLGTMAPEDSLLIEVSDFSAEKNAVQLLQERKLALQKLFSGCGNRIVVHSANLAEKTMDLVLADVKLIKGISPEKEVTALAGKIVFHFNTGSSKKLDQAETDAELGTLLDKIKSLPSCSLTLTGHADSRGETRMNQDLGLRRAESIKNNLIRLGMDKSALKTESKGESEPVADNSTDEGRAQNRRVEMKVTLK